MSAVRSALDSAYRAEWGRIVATIIGLTGDWDLAEECVADAFAQALERWQRDGIPDRPGAWLTTTARNRAIDRLRRANVEQTKLRERLMNKTAELPHADLDGADGALDLDSDSDLGDDRLRLIFTCCHPALALDARVALTLRTLVGLTTAEIARAFLVPEATMAKRLVRAKAKIRHAAIPYRVPPAHLLPERFHSVAAVVYLLFNEGYDRTHGSDLIRTSLCDEAIRLGELLVMLMPDEPEAGGLLALLMLQHARIAARVDEDGELVALDQQDRSLWNGALIRRAIGILERSLRRREPGPYQVQAAIAACHARSTRASETDWSQIVSLYGTLHEYWPTPIVELNQAVAIAMADGPQAGLAHIGALDLDTALRDFHLLHATNADLYRRLGRAHDARLAYDRAIQLSTNDTERRYLTRRRDE